MHIDYLILAILDATRLIHPRVTFYGSFTESLFSYSQPKDRYLYGIINYNMTSKNNIHFCLSGVKYDVQRGLNVDAKLYSFIKLLGC